MRLTICEDRSIKLVEIRTREGKAYIEALGPGFEKLSQGMYDSHTRTPAYAVICLIQNIDISAIFVSPILAQSVSNLSRTSDFSSNPYAYGSDITTDKGLILTIFWLKLIFFFFPSVL
jgi:hypothetical protein